MHKRFLFAFATMIIPTPAWADEARPDIVKIGAGTATRTMALDRFKATPRDFGKPQRWTPAKTVVRDGILDCERQMLGQVMVGQRCMTRNMPLIQQTDPRLDGDVSPWAGVGCYDTSLLTIILAQLANRRKSIDVVGRTAALLSITPWQGTPVEVRQLNYTYKMVRASQKQQELVAKGIIADQETYGLSPAEVVADVNGGRILEQSFGPKCNPFGEPFCADATNLSGASWFRWGDQIKDPQFLTNEGLAARMRQGYSMVLAYIRYTPVVAKVGGKTVVSFDDKNFSYHKVVPAGFQTGKHRLVLNDVGYTGVGTAECGGGEGCLRYNANLRTDLKAKLAELGIVADIVNPPAGVAPVILDYENGSKTQLFFIQHIDGLKLSAEP